MSDAADLVNVMYAMFHVRGITQIRAGKLLRIFRDLELTTSDAEEEQLLRELNVDATCMLDVKCVFRWLRGKDRSAGILKPSGSRSEKRRVRLAIADEGED
eukprot:TRINITY_DN49521_c0_g1_i1.p2 TRINITY_DN49521_c0_g1~~TRINITY_DN49521_c0_g1_i1.p2  ORF type:complete len:101 (-),score=19.66 TRINITY_DN49521_c0_g1_i1:254-556(-)